MSLFKKIKWGKWSQVVDTDNHIYKAQFRKCELTNEVDVRFISLWTSSACSVKAKIINASVENRVLDCPKCGLPWDGEHCDHE